MDRYLFILVLSAFVLTAYTVSTPAMAVDYLVHDVDGHGTTKCTAALAQETTLAGFDYSTGDRTFMCLPPLPTGGHDGIRGWDPLPIPAAPPTPETPVKPDPKPDPKPTDPPVTPDPDPVPGIPATPLTPATPVIPATPLTPATPVIPATPLTPATPVRPDPGPQPCTILSCPSV